MKSSWCYQEYFVQWIPCLCLFCNVLAVGLSLTCLYFRFALPLTCFCYKTGAVLILFVSVTNANRVRGWNLRQYPAHAKARSEVFIRI